MYKFPAAQETTTTKLPAFFQKLKKTVHNLRISKTEITSRNAFTVNFFALESVKNQKMTKGLSFEAAHVFFTCMLNLRPQIPHICVFLDCFSISQLLDTSCRFYCLKLTSLNYSLIFSLNKLNFYSLDVLVCCCASNQSSEIACIFSKILKSNALSKG